MSHNTILGNSRVTRHQIGYQPGQTFVLRRRVCQIIRSLELYPDRKIIAVGAVPKHRYSRVPGSLVQRDIMLNFTAPPNQRMCRHPQMLNGFKERMNRCIQRVSEQLPNPRSAELPRRETDPVDDDQGNRFTLRPFIVVGRQRQLIMTLHLTLIPHLLTLYSHRTRTP